MELLHDKNICDKLTFYETHLLYGTKIIEMNSFGTIKGKPGNSICSYGVIIVSRHGSYIGHYDPLYINIKIQSDLNTIKECFIPEKGYMMVPGKYVKNNISNQYDFEAKDKSRVDRYINILLEYFPQLILKSFCIMRI